MKSMTTDELLELLDANEDLNIIDVREDFEVENGMIPGATNIPLGDIPARTAELDQSKSYIVVCKGGVRSANACEYLAAARLRRDKLRRRHDGVRRRIRV